MMLNSVAVAGRLTADPEYKVTTTGKGLVRFCIAVDKDYGSASGEKATDFFNVLAWEKTADFICKYFSKGQMIIIQGRIQTSQYENRDGQKIKSYEIVTSNAYFGSSKPKEDKPERADAQTVYEPITEPRQPETKRAEPSYKNESFDGWEIGKDDLDIDLPF